LGTIAFFVFEYNNTLCDMNFATALMNSFFCSVTPRTAGFNSVDVASMTPQSKLVTILLMFVGGSSGSTAGGVKTGTIAVLFLCLFANMRNKNDIEIFDRRISSETIHRAVSVVLINFCNIFIAVILISVLQNGFNLMDIIFECTSAISTVGITTGITPDLNTASKIVIIALMYVGRLTSLIFALSFVAPKPKTTTQKPKGSVMVG
jgi:trk system potassium uptake protein TrkH